MPISSNNYVQITSVVGGAEAVSRRELMLRVFTTNERVPTGSVVQFDKNSLGTSLADYFGSTSTEYDIAAFYFSFISKVATSPQNIQYARWANTDTSAQVFGSEAKELATLQTYTAGAFDITLGGVAFNVTGLDFSANATYADVATTLQTRIQAEGGALAAATVTYNATRTAFEFDTNGVADGDISFTEVTANMLTDLGLGASAIFSAGVSAETVTDVLNNSTNMNNNFGSYGFIPELTTDQVTDSAVWVDGRNIEFMYLLAVDEDNRVDIEAAIISYASCGMTYNLNPEQYPQFLPAAILASQDWDQPAAAANYMYQQTSGLDSSVKDDSLKSTLDNARINYYGQTQEAGKDFSFYQNGQLTGGTSDPHFMGVHAGEQWMKAELKADFLNMFLALNIVAADDSGKAIGISYLDATVLKAQSNGVIAIGKTLTTTQKNYIKEITGDDKAYLDVQSRGYWYKVEVDATNNTMDYLLVYSKRDAVNKVEGRHVLI